MYALMFDFKSEMITQKLGVGSFSLKSQKSEGKLKTILRPSHDLLGSES